MGVKVLFYARKWGQFLIKRYFLRGKTAKQTKEKLDKCYGANAPSDYTVKYWFREFRGG